jgi:hypothetical protein
VLARFTIGDDENAAVSVDDLALEMGPRFARTQRGQDAIEHMVDLHLVRTEAEARDLFPTAAEVRAKYDEFMAKIAAQGLDADRYLRSKGISEREMLDYTTLTVALDRLVMRAVEITDPEAVTNEMRQLWLKEARAKHEVSTDADSLPEGVVAQIGRHRLTHLDLGRVLAARAPADERRKYVRQVVVRRALDRLAQDRGITVTPEDARAEVERIRTATQADAANQGVGYDAMLRALGTDVEQLQKSPVLRAKVIARKLMAERYPDALLETRLASEREAVLRQHGARRRIAILFLRATDAPNAIVRRDFAAAARDAEACRKKIVESTPFHAVARVESDDPNTKLKGGDAGWHHRDSSLLPAEVTAWAFAAERGALSQPIRAEGGIYLAMLVDVESDPAAEVIKERMREAYEEEFYRSVLADTKVQFSGGL